MAKKAKGDPIRDIIEVASSVYPDDLILSYYDEPAKDWGDGLAQFIAREITSVCSGAVCNADADTFYKAARAMTRVCEQMTDVTVALNERSLRLNTEALQLKKKGTK